MQCLNLKNKEVKAAFDEVAKVLNSEDAALQLDIVVFPAINKKMIWNDRLIMLRHIF